MKPTWFKHAYACGSMLSGGFMVFATVMYMNQQEKPPKEQNTASEVQFKVEQKPPKKKPKKKERRQKPQRQTRNAPAPKAPNLSSAISGVSLEFEGLGGFAMGGVSTDLIGKIDKKGPMTEGALDNPPKPTARRGNMDYPKDARKNGVEGYVTLNIYVKDDGTVGGVKILDSQPSGVFDASAKDYVREWVFSPGTYEGQSVDAWVKQTVRYKLQKS